MNQINVRRATALLCTAALMLSVVGCTQQPKSTTITVWHYYNGPLQTAFNSLVRSYNETEGAKKGVTVVASAQGNIGELTQKVLSAVDSGDTVPNIFAAYSDTAYKADSQGLLAPLDGYLSDEQLAAYIPGYIEEGRFDADGNLKIFPIAKSTELLYLNKTSWQPFAEATGAVYDDLATFEGVAATAAKYYAWTDSKTEEPNDGKAFLGRDSMANYMLIGARQLGVDLLAPGSNGEGAANLDPAVMQRLWDSFYHPYVSGHYAHLGKFRNDDMKTGDIIAFIGSSSAAAFLPKQVAYPDGTTVDIEIDILPPPQFEGGKNSAVQQGAGMVVSRSDSNTERACVDFLYWFTQPEQNLLFATQSGYLPVTRDAVLSSKQGEAGGVEAWIGMPEAIEITKTADMYTPKAFLRSNDARKVLESTLIDRAKEDRAKVEVMLANNVPYQEAISDFLQPKHFDSWLSSLRDALANVTG